MEKTYFVKYGETGTKEFDNFNDAFDFHTSQKVIVSLWKRHKNRDNLIENMGFFTTSDSKVIRRHCDKKNYKQYLEWKRRNS